VLVVDKFFREIAHLVIIDQGDGSHRFSLLFLPRLFDQLVPDKVPNGLLTVGISLFSD